MLKHRGSIGKMWDGNAVIARYRNPSTVDCSRYTLRPLDATNGDASHALFEGNSLLEVLHLSPHLDYLKDGDVVKISPRQAALRTLYRRGVRSNVVFTTERCNSYCLMCSQPPRELDDNHLLKDYLKVIPLMDASTKEVGISGGEPTLLQRGFLELIASCQKHLPKAAVHVLTNGRSFIYKKFCKELQNIGHKDLMLGIPLYSDLPARHDFIVQAKGAHSQTIRGLLNLAQHRIAIELRIVLHQQTIKRLPNLANFIVRNFPFVKQVAFMGLERMGFVKMNSPALLVDPADYQDSLESAIHRFRGTSIRPLIYNHQLCTLPRSLWRFNCRSISEWKNEYLEACKTCSVIKQCGGFFSSTYRYPSRLVNPITEGFN